MPSYTVNVPGQGSFTVNSPTELTDEQAYSAVQGQITSEQAPPTPTPEQQSSLRQVADVPLKLGAGALGGFRMLTDTLGANNPASQQLKNMEDSVSALFSAQSKNDSAEVARIMKEAEDKGFGDQITAALQAYATAPVDLTVNALGTMSPLVFVQLLKKGLKAFGTAKKVATTAQTAFQRLVPSKTSAAIGTAMGTGVIKGGIYDAVKEELAKTGMPPDQVEARAQLAQNYNGENLGLILGGAALGGLTAVTGVDPLLVKGMTKKIVGEAGKEAAKKGVVRRAVETGAAEAIPELLQGGQEQYAKNVALQKEGFDVPTMRGVVGSGALEGLAGGVLGAGVGAISPQDAPKEETTLGQEEIDAEEKQNKTEAEAKVAAGAKRYGDIVKKLMTDQVAEDGTIIRKGLSETEALQQAGNVIAQEEGYDSTGTGAATEVEPGGIEPSPEVRGGEDTSITQPTGEPTGAEPGSVGVLGAPAADATGRTEPYATTLADVGGAAEPTITGVPDVAEAAGRVEPTLTGGVAEIKPDVAEIKPDVAEIKDETVKDVAEIKPDVAEIKPDVAGIKDETVKDVAEIKDEAKVDPLTGLQAAGKKRGRPVQELTAEQKADKQQQRRAQQGSGIDAMRTADKAKAVVERPPLNEGDYANELELEDANTIRNAETVEALTQAYKIANDPRYRKNKAGVTASEVITNPNITPRQHMIAQNKAKMKDTAKSGQLLSTHTNPTTDPVIRAFKSAKDAVAYISRFGTVFEKTLVRMLKPFVGEITIVIVRDPQTDIKDPELRHEFTKGNGAAGMYAETSKGGVIYLDAISGLNNTVLLHEMLHGATMSKINSYLKDHNSVDKKTRDAIYDLMELMDRAGEYYKLLNSEGRVPSAIQILAKENGADVFNDLKEFISYGLTQPEMQEFLMSAPGRYKTDTFINSFVQSIRNLFNMGPQYKSAFHDLIIVTNKIAGAPKFTDKGVGKGQPIHSTEAGVKNLKKWFGKSKAVNADGTPKRWYHATVNDIDTFKTDKPIFLTDNPEFAERFSQASSFRAQSALESLLSPEQYAEMEAIVEKFKKDNPGKDYEEYDTFRRQVALGNANLGENIIPLYVRAENPFDYENPRHIEKALPSSDKELRDVISTGNWQAIETEKLQDAIKAAGFDSFYVKERGHKNLAVYSANQVKSAIGNTGAFSSSNEIALAKKPPKPQKIAQSIKKVLASHGATDLNKSIGELIRTTRNSKDAIRLLKAVGDSLNVGSIRKILPTLTTADITRWVGDKIANVNKVNDAVQDMAGMRSKMIRELAEQIPAWAEFNRKSEKGGELLSDVMHAATLEQVDPDKHKTLADALQNDVELKRLERAHADPKLKGKEKSAAAGLITKRKNEITRVYAIWVPLGKIAKGKGYEIYRMARDKYEETFRLHEQLLTEKIASSNVPGDINDASTQKGKLMASIAKTFQDAKKLGIYFPLMRYGNFWFSVGKGQSGEFYMFESAAARNNFRDIRVEELQKAGNKGTKDEMIAASEIDFGDNLRKMRAETVASSQMLKGIFEILDTNKLTDIDALKDQVYQMYLMTLPEQDMRTRFTHRQGKKGFGSDALRNFITSQHTAANQLSRLAYSDKIRNALGSAYAELKGNPDKLRLNAFIDEIALRVGAELMPQVAGEFNLDALASVGNQAVFFYMLTSPKSALVQMTQLPIVGLPILQAEYGYTESTKAFARYSFLFNKLGTSKKDANGNVTTNWGQPSINDSNYVNKHPDPAYRKVLKAAWEAANNRDIFMSTYAADMTSRSKTPTSEYEGWVSRGFRATVNFTGGAFHHLERISRETMYMASFELEFAKLKKEGVSDAEATEQGIKKATNLVYEALFNYTQYNKPRFMKKGLMRIPTQFLTYPMQMTSYLTRNFISMLSKLPAKERKDAAVKFFGTLGMTGLFSGVVGLPLYSVIMGAAEGARELMRPDMDSDDEDPYYDDTDAGDPLGKRSLDFWFRETFIPDFFGKGSSLAKALGLTDEQALMLQRSVKMGPISALTDRNIGASTSLNNLFFTDDAPAESSKEAFQQMLVGLTGPFGGMVGQGFAAVDDFNNGHINRGVEKLLPAFLRGSATAYRFHEEGLQTRDGYVVRSPEWYTAARLFTQALGVQSTEVAEIQKKSFLAMQMNESVKRDRQEVLDKLDLALRRYDDKGSESNQKKLDEAIKDIRVYNYKNRPFPIDDDAIMTSLENRAKNRGLGIEGLRATEKEHAVLQPLLEKSRVDQK